MPRISNFVNAIELDEVGQPRSSAQGLLFGRGGDLFVPGYLNAGRRFDLPAAAPAEFAPRGNAT